MDETSGNKAQASFYTSVSQIATPIQFELLNHLPIGACVLHADGTVLFWNRVLEEWTAIAQEQLVGRRLSDYFPQFAQISYSDRLKPVFEKGKTVIFSSQLHPYFIPAHLPNGKLRMQHTVVMPLPSADGQQFDALISIQDLTHSIQYVEDYQLIQEKAWFEIHKRQQVEGQLQQDRDLLNSIVGTSVAAIAVVDLEEQIIFANNRAQVMLGSHQQEMLGLGYNTPEWKITDFAGNSFQSENLPFARVKKTQKPVFDVQYAVQVADGACKYLSINAAPLFDSDNLLTGIVFTAADVTDRYQAETALNLYYQQERLLENIVQHIRQSLDINQILQTTVAEIQQFLKADRVLIYHIENLSASTNITLAACFPECSPLLKAKTEQFFANHSEYLYPFQTDRVLAINDITQAALEPAYVELLKRSGVRSRLALPIWLHKNNPGSSTQSRQIWGFLIVHQCQSQRQWHFWEIALLKRFESQLAVAIQQAELYQQVQELNADLEQRVRERTHQLERSLDFEATLKRITDKVRDSLDEDQILQTAVEELGQILNVKCCDTSIFSENQTLARINHEYSPSLPSILGDMVDLSDTAGIHRYLLQGKTLQFCPLACSSVRSMNSQATILCCPIFDDQGVLGGMWLFRDRQDLFNELETRLVQQVVNQCAIAIRQSRLYRATQTQVQELEKLNHLKDDFLSTISHELRTPLSNIRMSVQLLEILIQQEQPNLENYKGVSQIQQCLKILQDECDREINLVNDILALQHLEAGTQPFEPTTIQLQDLITQISDSFEERIQRRSQLLQVIIPPDLPAIVSDTFMLTRILNELLTNACKFTPEQEQIRVSANTIARSEVTSEVQISVENFGVSIDADELEPIFQQFYRIPNRDPWKYSGTGMGLALVRKLATYLGGAVWAESKAQSVRFVVQLPFAYSRSARIHSSTF